MELFRQTQTIKKQAEDLAFHNREQQQQILLIQDLNQRLKAANEELEAFSYSVSHDLRSSLRAMHGYAQALLEDYDEKLEPEGKEYLHRIKHASLRMDSLIQDILAYSCVSKTELQTEVIDLEDLMIEIIQQYRVLQEPHTKILIEKPLHRVMGHQGSLTQCLSNLLSNAVKFVSQTMTPTIHIRTERQGGRVRLWISDNGIGIDPAHFERIFQMFGRVHHEKIYEGTGMGLTIVKKAVERMGGTVGVQSDLGADSHFWIELAQAGECVGKQHSLGL